MHGEKMASTTYFLFTPDAYVILEEDRVAAGESLDVLCENTHPIPRCYPIISYS